MVEVFGLGCDVYFLVTIVDLIQKRRPGLQLNSENCETATNNTRSLVT